MGNIIAGVQLHSLLVAMHVIIFIGYLHYTYSSILPALSSITLSTKSLIGISLLSLVVSGLGGLQCSVIFLIVLL